MRRSLRRSAVVAVLLIPAALLGLEGVQAQPRPGGGGVPIPGGGRNPGNPLPNPGNPNPGNPGFPNPGGVPGNRNPGIPNPNPPVVPNPNPPGVPNPNPPSVPNPTPNPKPPLYDIYVCTRCGRQVSVPAGSGPPTYACSCSTQSNPAPRNDSPAPFRVEKSGVPDAPDTPTPTPVPVPEISKEDASTVVKTTLLIAAGLFLLLIVMIVLAAALFIGIRFYLSTQDDNSSSRPVKRVRRRER